VHKDAYAVADGDDDEFDEEDEAPKMKRSNFAKLVCSMRSVANSKLLPLFLESQL
jgi:hypothetical protein